MDLSIIKFNRFFIFIFSLIVTNVAMSFNFCLNIKRHLFIRKKIVYKMPLDTFTYLIYSLYPCYIVSFWLIEV